jgi:hypothetical protein
MTDEPDKNSPDAVREGGREERRRDKRYTIPPVYRRYIQLSVRKNDEAIDSVLSVFSRHGILFESPLPYAVGTHANCILSIPRLLSRDIELGLEVRSCKQEADLFLVGAAIETIADETWFNVFVEIHDFIVQRQDTIY